MTDTTSLLGLTQLQSTPQLMTSPVASGEIFLRGDAITRPNLISIFMLMEEEV
ncbi:hypothetical protein TIFTF001_009702 [Ficus carica]|uniref:Uncharacterized protein n=1 Tax=Ficus carica TaxID=3494 RepID=A0AA87ZWW7_FICCA|nr:hypothetical protein TIFTF001_009702 [Ficus carica]